MSYLDWHVGLKVVCVDNEEPEGGWFPWRFRPVQQRKTDISIFTAMLTKTKVPA